MTIAEACLFGLGIVGRDAATTEVCFELDDYTIPQVRGGLTALTKRKTPAAVQVVRGRPGYGHPSVWRLTAAGRAWLDAECGPDDDDPVRVPCGLGWPPDRPRD